MQEVRLLASLPPHVFPFAAGKVLIRNCNCSSEIIKNYIFPIWKYKGYVENGHFSPYYFLPSNKDWALTLLEELELWLVSWRVTQTWWSKIKEIKIIEKLFIDGHIEGDADLVINRNEEIEQWMSLWMVIIAINIPPWRASRHHWGWPCHWGRSEQWHNKSSGLHFFLFFATKTKTKNFDLFPH